MSGELPVGEDDLNAWIDGQLAPERADAVADYLRANPNIAARVREQAAQRLALRDAFAPVAAEPIPPGLRVAHIAANRRRAPRWLQPAIAASLLLGVGFGGGWGLHGRFDPPQAGIGALAREAASSYRVYAVGNSRPVEIGPEHRATLVNWVSDELGSTVAIPDLGRAGYRFAGGRLVATPHGPAAMFLYDRPGQPRLTVLVRRMEIDRQTRMSEHVEGDVAGISWATAGMGYSLTGERAAGELHPIADDMRRQLDRRT